MKYIFLIFVSVFLSSCSKKYTGKVSFKSCTVNYEVINVRKEKQLYGQNAIGNQWRLESAKQELALCLCEKYLKKQG